MTRTGGDHDASDLRATLRWHLAALLVFAACLTSLFHRVVREDLTKFVPARILEGHDYPSEVYPTGPMAGTDHRFVTWLIARNAHTLLTQPSRLFDAEPCHPSEHALTFNEPGIALGLLATPFWLSTRDPVATFTFTFLTMTFLHALAMYLLVREWTGVPAAGIVAAVLFAFHDIRLTDSVHIYVWDCAWTVFAFLFARRLFDTARWRDAIGLAFVCVMQIGGSFYPLVGAVFIALPLMVWLVAHYGVSRLRPLQWIFVLACIGAATFVFLGPYLALRDTGEMEGRTVQLFRHLQWLIDPDGHGYPGIVLIGLMLLGVLLPAGRTASGFVAANARWALLAGCLVSIGLAFGALSGETPVLLIDTDPAQGFKNLYMVFASVVPGFEVVRSPGSLYAGAHVTGCILAGYGAAALIRRVSARYALALSLALIALAYVDTLRPRSLGFDARLDYVPYEMRPISDALDLYAELDALGNDGPILEIPVNTASLNGLSRGVLLSAYHHRRTSQCYSTSRIPGEIIAMNEALPSQESVRAARAMGFTTIVLRHEEGDAFMRKRRRQFILFAQGVDGQVLRKIYGNDSMTAYEIRIPDEADRSGV